METEILATVAGIVVLLILSGFFSGSETALTAYSRPRMHLLEREGNERARQVNRLHAEKEKLIGAILLGNNLVNILGSALATSLLIAVFGDRGVVYATVAMTLLILVFGEVMPKTYALQNADRMALAVAPLVRPMVALFGPVTHGLVVVVRAVMGALGVRLASEQEMSAAAEEVLRGAIDLYRGEEPEVRQERIMLRSILDLSEVDVSEVMHHRQDIVEIDADLPPARIIEQVVESPYTRIPLWRGEKDNIVGVLHAKALLRQVYAHRGNLDEIDISAIATPPWFIPESTSLLDQLQAFRRRHEHFALVVDEYGSLMGVVTLEDILEEIVGDITDETDVVLMGVRPQEDGSLLVDGRVTIRDLNRRYDWNLPDEEASTIAGLVIQIARVIPEERQIFHFNGFRFEVMRRRSNRLALIRLTPPSKGGEQVRPAGR